MTSSYHQLSLYQVDMQSVRSGQCRQHIMNFTVSNVFLLKFNLHIGHEQPSRQLLAAQVYSISAVAATAGVVVSLYGP